MIDCCGLFNLVWGNIICTEHKYRLRIHLYTILPLSKFPTSRSAVLMLLSFIGLVDLLPLCHFYMILLLQQLKDGPDMTHCIHCYAIFFSILLQVMEDKNVKLENVSCKLSVPHCHFHYGKLSSLPFVSIYIPLCDLGQRSMDLLPGGNNNKYLCLNQQLKLKKIKTCLKPFMT